MIRKEHPAERVEACVELNLSAHPPDSECVIELDFAQQLP